MRVAIDARMIKVTGIGRYIRELVKAELSLGVKLTLMVTEQEQHFASDIFPSAKLIVAPEPIYSWSEQLLLPARLRKENFDLVHFTNFNFPVSYREPYVLTIHDLTPLSFGGERRAGWVSQKAYRYVINSGLERASRVMVPTRHVKEQLPKKRKGAKVSVVPYALADIFRNASDSQWVPQKYGINRPYVLYVGNFRSHKNIASLVQAFNIFARTCPDSQLVLTGPIDRKKKSALMSLADQTSSPDNIIFTDRVSEQELINIYDQAKLFVLPSFKEGYGFVALEAAARGLPVLVSSQTPVREFLGRGVLSFEPTKIDQLADLMSLVWSDQILADRLVRIARPLALSNTWQAVAKQILSIYQQACSERITQK